MKSLSDTPMFAGKTETITVGDFRKQPGDVFLKVMMGMSFIITKRGKKIATLKSTRNPLRDCQANPRAKGHSQTRG